MWDVCLHHEGCWNMYYFSDLHVPACHEELKLTGMVTRKAVTGRKLSKSCLRIYKISGAWFHMRVLIWNISWVCYSNMYIEPLETHQRESICYELPKTTHKAFLRCTTSNCISQPILNSSNHTIWGNIQMIIQMICVRR